MMTCSKPIIVWDLFGGGQNSVYEALKDNPQYDIYTFDITEPTRQKQYVLDLSNDSVLEELAKYPSPDIIVASPLCQSFSQVLTMKGGGTCFWKLCEDGSLCERSVAEFEELKAGFTKNLKAEKQLAIKELGEKCLINTIRIIAKYQPKYFYIENPKKSLMWNFIKYNMGLNGEYNYATYSKYGYMLPKDTCFFSNVKLNLEYQPHFKNCYEKDGYLIPNELGEEFKIKKGSGRRQLLAWSACVGQGKKYVPRTYGGKENEETSSIPEKLIQEIFKKWKESSANFEK